MASFLHNFVFYHILLISLFFTPRSMGQPTITTTGKASIQIESNMTREQAREIAREKAMINAIENALGTFVEQNTDIRVEDGKVQYNIIGTTKVKGDWLRTIKEDFTEEADVVKTREGKNLDSYILCSITGEVRRASAKAAIKFHTLNCPEPGCDHTDFYSGQSMYLSFKSPIDGYLSVFLDDGERVYRLFPYSTMKGVQYSAGFINGDTEYVLFSRKRNQTPFIPDEFELYSLKQGVDYNYIYVLFSNEPYEKPMLDDQTLIPIEGVEYIIPKSLSYKEFAKWLAQNRAVLPGFIDARIKVSIKQKN